jgi:hypothetical protein
VVKLFDVSLWEAPVGLVVAGVALLWRRWVLGSSAYRPASASRRGDVPAGRGSHRLEPLPEPTIGPSHVSGGDPVGRLKIRPPNPASLLAV